MIVIYSSSFGSIHYKAAKYNRRTSCLNHSRQIEKFQNLVKRLKATWKIEYKNDLCVLSNSFRRCATKSSVHCLADGRPPTSLCEGESLQRLTVPSCSTVSTGGTPATAFRAAMTAFRGQNSI